MVREGTRRGRKGEREGKGREEKEGRRTSCYYKLFRPWLAQRSIASQQN